MIKISNKGKTYHYYYKKKDESICLKRGPKPKSKDDIDQNYSFYFKYTRKYSNKYLFKEKDSIRYEYCEKMGWIEKLYPYVCLYTKKQCVELCKQYQHSEHLKKENFALYECLEKHGWLNIFCDRKERYRYSECKKVALKYKTYKEFKEAESSIYTYCLHNKLLKEYTWLKDDRVFIYEDPVDCVYGYFFNELKTAYIGRTLMRRAHDRDLEHLYENSVVSKFAKEKNIEVPPMTILETGLTIIEGLEKEDFYINHYMEMGYNILNKAKTGVGHGSVGIIGKGKWNREKCYEVALKYNRVSDFEKDYGGAFRVAKRNGWINEYTWFKEKPKRNYWTFDKCKEAAEKCESRSEFSKKYGGAYLASVKNEWIGIFFNKESKNGYKYMKSEKIYKIDPSTMKIVETYKKVKEITNNKDIYRVLNGEKYLLDDGFLYRREEDVVVNVDGTIINKLIVDGKTDKIQKKYKYAIDLMKNNRNLKLIDLHRICNANGFKISYATYEKLKRLFLE